MSLTPFKLRQAAAFFEQSPAPDMKPPPAGSLTGLLRGAADEIERGYNAGVQAAWERAMMMANALPMEPVTSGGRIMRDAALDIADSILDLKIGMASLTTGNCQDG